MIGYVMTILNCFLFCFRSKSWLAWRMFTDLDCHRICLFFWLDVAIFLLSHSRSTSNHINSPLPKISSTPKNLTEKISASDGFCRKQPLVILAHFFDDIWAKSDATPTPPVTDSRGVCERQQQGGRSTARRGKKKASERFPGSMWRWEMFHHNSRGFALRHVARRSLAEPRF